MHKAKHLPKLMVSSIQLPSKVACLIAYICIHYFDQHRMRRAGLPERSFHVMDSGRIPYMTTAGNPGSCPASQNLQSALVSAIEEDIRKLAEALGETALDCDIPSLP